MLGIGKNKGLTNILSTIHDDNKPLDMVIPNVFICFNYFMFFLRRCLKVMLKPLS